MVWFSVFIGPFQTLPQSWFPATLTLVWLIW